MTLFGVVESPIDDLMLVVDADALVGLYMTPHLYAPDLVADGVERDDSHPVVRAAATQLQRYFAGELREFDLPLRLVGTPFQRRVWEALLEIPYGTTVSYGALATRLGDAGASRAVGLANGHNPVSVVVPCHRVIGADGSLTGYGGGVDRKRWLLSHESDHAGSQGALFGVAPVAARPGPRHVLP